MTRTARPGLVLAAGAALGIAAGLAPAGIGGGAIPAASWAVWGCALAAAIAGAKAGGRPAASTLRALVWLGPVVLLLTLPAAWFAAKGRGTLVAAALVVRALSSSAATLATVAALGPSGVVAGLRALRVPARLVAIVQAMLVALAAIARQVAAMKRARAARRARARPFAALLRAPSETLEGFGSLTAAVLLRSIERAESLERARRARGGAPS